MRFFVHAGILILLGCLALAADTRQAYSIVMDRGSTVGEKYNIAVTGSDQSVMSTSSKGKVLTDASEVFTMQLDGTVQILEINERKGPIKESITIAKCVKVVDKQEVPLATKGTVVIAAVVDDKDTFTINGEPVSEDLLHVFNIAISLSKKHPGDDEVFGTKEPQHVGDSWNYDATMAVNSLADIGMSVAAKDITGKATLKEVLMVGDQQCLRIAGQLQIAKMKPANFPPELTIKTATCTVNTSSLYPVDVLQRKVEEQVTMTMQLVVEGRPSPDAPIVTDKATMKRTALTKYSKAE